MLMQELGNKGVMECCFKRPERLLLNVRLFVAICFFVVAFHSPVLSDDWPMLFHDPGMTCASLDREVKPPFQILWRYAVEDNFGAHGNHGHKPIVADGIVYISGVFHEKTPNKAKSMLLALDALKGTPVWRKEGRFSMPAVSQGTLFTVQVAGKDVADFQALALEAKAGEPKWQMKIRSLDGFAYVDGPYVVVQEDLLFLVGSRGIVVLNRETGKPAWDWSYDGEIPKGYGSSGLTVPPIDQDGVYFVDAQGTVNALDPKTGKTKWKKENIVRKELRIRTICHLMVADGVLIITNDSWISDPLRRMGHRVYALNTKDGSLLWQRGVLCGGKTPALADGVLYMTGGDGYTGTLALDARTGAYLWDRYIIPGVNRACCGLFYANGAIYTYAGHCGGSRETTLVCLDASCGKTLWTSSNRVGQGSAKEWDWEAACAGPSFANGILYLATWHGGILALVPEDGTDKLKTRTP